MSETMNEDIKIKIENELQRIEEDSDYSARSCLEASLRWKYFYLWIGIPATVLAAISGVISAINGQYSAVTASALSIFIAILAGMQTFLKPNETSNSYKIIGNKYLSLKNRARTFRTIRIQLLENNQDFILQHFEELVALRDELNSECPSIPRWAYERAKSSIAAGETTHKVDN